MTQTKMIHAQKGTMQTKFTAMVWKHMGVNKNGWQQISEEQYVGGAPSGAPTGKPSDVNTEAEYKKLYAQGKGFEQDTNLVEALARFESAAALKPSPSIKGKIAKLKQAIAELQIGAGRAELIAAAEIAEAEGDLASAIEAYESAQEIEVTAEVGAKIVELDKKIEDTLVA